MIQIFPNFKKSILVKLTTIFQTLQTLIFLCTIISHQYIYKFQTKEKRKKNIIRSNVQPSFTQLFCIE